LTAAAQTAALYQRKRADLRKQVDTQAQTLAGFWRERVALEKSRRRWQVAFLAAVSAAVLSGVAWYLAVQFGWLR
jgi:hypothetical protein